MGGVFFSSLLTLDKSLFDCILPPLLPVTGSVWSTNEKTRAGVPSKYFSYFFFLSKTQSKKSYEQRCREADEAKLTAERLGTAPTATPKQIEKVNMFEGATHKQVLSLSCIVN